MHRSKHQIFSQLWMTLLFLTPALSTCLAGDSVITITGEAETSVNADSTVLAFDVRNVAKTIVEAVKENQQKMEAINAYLRKVGQTDATLITESFSIRVQGMQESYASKGGQVVQDPFGAEDPFSQPPVQQRQGGDAGIRAGQQAGLFEVHRSVTVELTNLRDMEQTYQGLAELSVYRYRRVEYRTSHEKELLMQLRVEAVRNARDKASAMAKALDARLSAIKSMRETSSNSSSDPFATPFDGRGAASSNSARINLQSAVEIVFELDNVQLK